jgi:hypothetical protein
MGKPLIDGSICTGGESGSFPNTPGRAQKRQHGIFLVNILAKRSEFGLRIE